MKVFGSMLAVVVGGLAVLAGAATTRTAELDFSQPLYGLTLKRLNAKQDASPDRQATHLSRLHDVRGVPGLRTATSALGRTLRAPPPHGQHSFQNISKVGAFSTQYAVQCGWDGVPLWLLIDTGSSDTWAVQEGFQCDDRAPDDQSRGDCGFGRPFIQDFGHGAIPDLHMYMEYGSGEKIYGPMGYSDLSCGGLQVFDQQVGLANYTYWHGNNMTTGILGLAYPSITSAFYGDIGSEAPWNAITYSPFLTNAVMQGAMDPLFSVTLAKNSSGGLLGWGGLPPMESGHGPAAVTDLIIANLIGSAETSWRYSFYTIIPDGIRWGSTTDETKFPYIVDTGTTMNYVPPPLAEAIAMAFQPRAVFLYQWGSYFAPCNAVAPRVSVIIGSEEFHMNPADLIFKDLKDPLTGYCAIAIASGGSGPYILGDVFLQSVVAVFDVGAAQMRFYQRT
ncbi:hypothetical protein HIM_01603 [Hirsutella minnesotensis 3608]|nr:hypothetical protein HIM_01603 [Hirsutella minnesotensis 3608]